MPVLRLPHLGSTSVLAPPLLLVSITLAVYGNSLANGFVWDDEHIIVQNPRTRDLASIGTVLLTPDEVAPYYRPLNRASYLIDFQLFGMDPAGFHAVNLGLHAASVLLLFLLGSRLFAHRGPALLGALLLAVHPIHSEPVNFITGRNNLLALLFSLATFVSFLDAHRRGSQRHAWISAAAFFLGLLSKEQALMVLAVIAAWLVLPGHGKRSGAPSWSLLRPHALALVVYATLRTIALDGAGTGPQLLDGLPERIAQNYFVLPHYLRLVLFPRDLTIFHSLPGEGSSSIWPLAAWTIMVLGLAIAAWRRTPASTAGLLWLVANLLPIANIVPIPSAPIAERYLYVPVVGLWLLLADGLDRLSIKLARPALFTASIAVIVTVLAGRTAVRNLDWRDDLRLAASAVAVNPRSARAQFNLGVALKDAGDLRGARAAWEAASRIDPADGQTLTQLGTVAALDGDFAQAARYYRDALRSDPAISIAHLNLAKIYDRSARPAEALAHYEDFLRISDSFYAEHVPVVRQRVAELRAVVFP